MHKYCINLGTNVHMQTHKPQQLNMQKQRLQAIKLETLDTP